MPVSCIAPPFCLHSHTSSKFLPRRPLPRQPWFDGANKRLRHRSTANPAALSRLFRWLRHLSLLWVRLPVYFCSQPIVPHVVGDADSSRLRQSHRWFDRHTARCLRALPASNFNSSCRNFTPDIKHPLAKHASAMYFIVVWSGASPRAGCLKTVIFHANISKTDQVKRLFAITFR